ncbi:MAG: hypothetical protein JWO16_488 [Sphingomonas bacterium]|nr:hypothetical protein [Sphingomonas bacterium]
MARILLVGIDPDLVDFSDPAVPPGMNADMIRRGIRTALEEMTTAGHEPHHLYIPVDPAGVHVLSDKLAGEPFDCVVVGGGVRIPPSNLLLFEAVLNTIVRAVLRPPIALVAHPGEAAAAVARVLGQGGQ